MDMKKLFEKLIADENIQKIPLNYVLEVFYAVINAINSGECYYENHENE